MKPIACDCSACQSMCEHSTCLPTPTEARALIKAGHAGRLATYAFGPLQFVGPAPAGQEGARDLAHTRHGRCTFRSATGCELHGAGLKPLEGRLAHHTRHWLSVREQVAPHWRGRMFDSVLRSMDSAMHGLGK